MDLYSTLRDLEDRLGNDIVSQHPYDGNYHPGRYALLRDVLNMLETLHAYPYLEPYNLTLEDRTPI